MKRLCTALFVLLFMVSCSKEPFEPHFSIAETNYELESEEVKLKIELNSNLDYTFDIDCNWIVPAGKNGANRDSAVFIVGNNPTNDSREGSIVFVSEDGAFRETVNVFQYGRHEIYYTVPKSYEYQLSGLTGEEFGAKIISHTFSGGKGTITFDKKITRIGKQAFSYYSNHIVDIDIPNTVTHIGEKAFSWCAELLEITLPDSVVEIGEYSFEYCAQLTKVNLPEGVRSIKEGAFYNCFKLSSVKLPDDLQQIGDYTFYCCNELTGITIPVKLKKLGEAAFIGCNKLDSLVFGSGITVIKDDTFRGCSSLKNIVLPQTLDSIGFTAFAYCSALEELKLPATVRTIAPAAFNHCISLKEMTLPEGMTTISANIVGNCTNLTKVELPASVIKLEEGFTECSSLTSLICHAPVPPEFRGFSWGIDTQNLKIYVPQEAVDKYKQAEVWKDYANIIFPIE